MSPDYYTLLLRDAVSGVTSGVAMCGCRVHVPERERKVCGLAARQKVKLGQILNQVHSDIIAEREAGESYVHHHKRESFSLDSLTAISYSFFIGAPSMLL